MLDLLQGFYQASEESSRVQGGLAFRPPPFTVAPGLPTDPGMGMPWSMRIINGRRLKTVGDYRNLSPEEKAYLEDQKRCWIGGGLYSVTAGLTLGGQAAIVTGARRGGLGPPRASLSSTACSVLSPPPTSSGARPSSSSCATSGLGTAGRTLSRTRRTLALTRIPDADPRICRLLSWRLATFFDCWWALFDHRAAENRG
jgi:hypothetical protein